jgi:hypothetical protein
MQIRDYQVEPEGFWEGGKFAGDGYDRMGLFAKLGWDAISSWGSDGWDLGDWPYVMVFFRRRKQGEPFSVAVNVEGDTTRYDFSSEEERNEGVSWLAVFFWRARSGPMPPLEKLARPYLRVVS